MNKLPVAKRAHILGMMVEGVSIRAISRMTGASKNTIVKLLADAGQACSEYQDRTLVNLLCKRLQADEIRSLGYASKRTFRKRYAASFGVEDVWTWTALCGYQTCSLAEARIFETSAEAAGLTIHEFGSN